MATSNTTPIVIPQPIAAQATSENINVIPNGATGTNGASFQEGFPAITRMPVIENPLPTQVSGLPPKQQDFNGLFNVVSQHNFFAQNGGTYSFNQAVSDAIGGYAKNQILWYFPANGLPIPVVSMIDNNTYNFAENPSYIDGEKWSYIVANTSLNNLSATGQAIIDSKQDVATAVNYDNITNCLTKIPQDIKLELNNGTLTLKAGSKVYVPNGFEEDGVTPKFDVVVIESDISDPADRARQAMVWCKKNNGKYYINSPIPLTYCYSGSTAPTSFYVGKLALWYDTKTNLIKYTRNSGATWDNQGHSLPLAIVTETTTAYISIDQIFNGFGYIGSTVFALPGVNGLIPNGRNEDGTLKNIEFTTTSVLTQTIPAEWGNPTFFAVDNLGFSAYAQYGEDGFINGFGNQMWYDSNENLLKGTGDNRVHIDVIKRTYCFRINHESGRITLFTPKTAFHAVDYSDSAQRANPTGTIIIWASNNAPDGYLICNGAAVSRTTYARLFNVIGTTWGAGDGNTTFNLPNAVGRYAAGGTVGTYVSESLPNITGNISGIRNLYNTGTTVSGAFSKTAHQNDITGNNLAQTAYDLSFNASRSSSAYKDKAKVRPDSFYVAYYIKY